jgi:hypothetical protein
MPMGGSSFKQLTGEIIFVSSALLYVELFTFGIAMHEAFPLLSGPPGFKKVSHASCHDNIVADRSRDWNNNHVMIL